LAVRVAAGARCPTLGARDIAAFGGWRAFMAQAKASALEHVRLATGWRPLSVSRHARA